MSSSELTSLCPGMRLPKALFTRQGVKLLNAGVMLTEAMCRTLVESSWGQLVLADDAGEIDPSASQGWTAPGVGERASADIVTRGGVLVLQAGELIEPHHADALALGGFYAPTTREARRQRAALWRIAEVRAAELTPEWDQLPRRIEPDAARPEPLARPGAPWPQLALVIQARLELVMRFRGLLARVLSGVACDAAEARLLVDELLAWHARDPDRFAQLALIGQTESEYLPDHCVTTAALSVAIASRLGWSERHIGLAGLAGLLADVGMGLVPAELRGASRPLDEVELNRVRRHPMFSVALLEALRGLPEEARLAAAQHHERENGSGYPSQRRAAQITDIAKVVAVADAFAAASAPRRHRPARRGYDVIEELVMLASSGVFERGAVRALTEGVGLFPVGSFVLLTSGERALVVGSHAHQIDRPIIRVLGRAPGGYAPGLAIDLDAFSPAELGVAQAIDPPGALVLAAGTAAA